MQPTQTTWSTTLRSFWDRRLLSIFLLGMCSGFPWVLTGAVLSRWLQDAGYAKSEIGLFALTGIAFTFNFLWAPLVDRFKPLSFLGRRKAWILLAQLVVLAACVLMSLFDPKHSAWWIALVAVVICFAAATQDIAIDAFRIDSFSKAEQTGMAHGASLATAGWWTGHSFLGGLVFTYREDFGLSWGETYPLMAGMWLAIMVLAHWSMREVNQPVQLKAATFQDELWNTVVMPFLDFFKRSGVQLGLALLAFVFLFKIGEAFLGKMSILFYSEVGFTDEEIGKYSKLIGWFTTIVFAIIGGFFNARFGVVKGMILGGTAMAASNLMFSVMAYVGPSVPLLVTTVVVDGFTTAFSTVAFVTFISWFTSTQFSATQYALLASLGTAGRTALASGSGYLVEFLDNDWAIFFAITALMVVPSLLLLIFYVGPKIKAQSS